MAYPAILRPYFKILRPYFSIILPYSAIKGTLFYQNQWFLELFLAKNAFCCHTFICCHSTANALYKGFPNDVWQCGSKFPKTKKVNRMLIAHYILVSPFKIIKRCAPSNWSTFINYLILAANLAGLRRLSHISTIQIVVLVT